MEISAEVWLEKVTFLPLPSPSGLFQFMLMRLYWKTISKESNQGKVCCTHLTVLRMGSCLSPAQALHFLVYQCTALHFLVLNVKKTQTQTKKKPKTKKKPLTYLYPWGTKLNFVVTAEWISKTHQGRKKGGMEQTVGVLEMRSFGKKRKIEDEWDLEEVSFRKEASGDQDIAGDYRYHGGVCKARGYLHLLLSLSLFPKCLS